MLTNSSRVCLDNMSSPWLLISNLRLTSVLCLVIKPLIRSQILKFNQVKKVFFVKKRQTEIKPTKPGWNKNISGRNFSTSNFSISVFLCRDFQFDSRFAEVLFPESLALLFTTPRLQKISEFLHPHWQQSFSGSKWPEQSYGATRWTGM